MSYPSGTKGFNHPTWVLREAAYVIQLAWRKYRWKLTIRNANTAAREAKINARQRGATSSWTNHSANCARVALPERKSAGVSVICCCVSPPRKHTHPCVRACACVRVCVRACGAQPALSSSHAARLRQQHEAEDRRRHEARRVLQSLLQRYAHRRRFRVEKEEEARRSRAREEEEARRICWEAEQQRLRIEAQDEAKRLRLASIKLALKVKQRGSCLRKRIRV